MKFLKSEVDIILPNYNSARYIKQTIESIKKQSFKNWKLIIVDDASNLKTKKILSKLSNNKRIKVIWLPKNKGAGYCRNLAIKKSFSKYIAFIDSDDLWEKKKLELQIKFMKKNKCNFSYTYYKTFGLKNNNITPQKKYNFSSFIKDTSIATSTMMVNRKAAKNIKFTNTEICEDFFFKCKMLKKVNFAYCITNFLTKYRIRHKSLQSNKFRNLLWMWKINKNFNKLTTIDNLKSLISISFNSIKKYGLK